jgi:hypothetical protein
VPSGVLVSCYDSLFANYRQRIIEFDLESFHVIFIPKGHWDLGWGVLFTSAWFANLLLCLGYIRVSCEFSF